MDGEVVFLKCCDRIVGLINLFCHRSFEPPMMYRYYLCKAVMVQVYQVLVAQVTDKLGIPGSSGEDGAVIGLKNCVV